MTDKNKLFFLLLGLLLITLGTFSTSLTAGFVNWDDNLAVYQNSDIQQLGWNNLKKFFTSSYLSNYMPLTMISFALDYHFFHFLPFAYHWTNLKLHLFNVLLVFWFIFLLGGQIEVAFLTALFFAIHPQRVESVVWIAERKDVLFSFFFLGALIAYCYYLKTEKKKLYFFCLILFILALLAKVVALVLILVLWLLDYYFQRRGRRIFWEKVPFFLVAIPFFLFGIYSQHPESFKTGLVSFDIFNCLAGFAFSTSFILWKMLLPVKLSCLYYSPEEAATVPFAHWLAGTVLLAALVFLAVFFVKSRRRITFGITFFLIMLLPVLGLVVTGQGPLIQDRYNYLASVGVLFLLADFLVFVGGRLKKSSLISGFYFFLIVLVSGLVFLTVSASFVWRNSFVLWSNVLKNRPGTVIAYMQRGLAYFDKGDFKGALADYNRVVALRPNYSLGYLNRGCAYLKLKGYQKVIEDCDRAIKLGPAKAVFFANRAAAYEALGKFDQALEDYRQGLQLEPRNYALYLGIAAIYQRKKQSAQAAETYEQVLKLKPDYKDAYLNFWRLYYHLQKFDQAVMVCERALAKGVRDGEIFYRQSQAYFGAGRYQEALMSARQALVLKNNYAPARNLEGLVHKKLGQFREAVTDFSAAIKNDPGFFDAYLNRGKVYGILNKNEEALADLRRAFELGPEGGEAAYYLAVVLYQKKELSSARTWLLRAERLGFKGASKEFLEGVGRGGK